MKTLQDGLPFVKDGLPFVLAMGGVVVGLVVANRLLNTLPPAGQEELLVEAGKAAIGMVPLAFFGVIVASLLRGRDDRRAEAMKVTEERREESRRLGDFRRRFLGDVVVAYNRVKSARRLIRAAGIDPKSTRTFDAAAISVFNAQLNVLTDAELDIEELRREAESRGTAFSNKSEAVAALAALESYVSRIGEDQEKHAWEIGEGTPMTKLVEWGGLAAFLTNVGSGGDFRDASRQLETIEKAIWPDLLSQSLGATA